MGKVRSRCTPNLAQPMPYIDLGNGLRARVDADVFAALGHLPWYAAKSGRTEHRYVRCARLDPMTGRRMLLHHAVARLGGVPGDGPVVHHRGGDPLDNRRSQLLRCSARENASARRRSPGRTYLSRYHGVTRDRRGRFVAQITVHGRTIRIGTFGDGTRRNTARSEREAAIARDRVARLLLGEFAITNFPTDDGRELTTRVDPNRSCGKRRPPPIDLDAVIAGTHPGLVIQHRRRARRAPDRGARRRSAGSRNAGTLRRQAAPPRSG